MKDDFFMTTKEKDYVSECFSRNINFFKTNIDYKNIFNFKGSKIPYVYADAENRKSSVFGKESKKNNKRSRQYASLDTDQMPKKLSVLIKLEDIIAKITLFKYYEGTDCFVDEVLAQVYTNFSEMVKISKFFSTFESLYLFVNEVEKNKLFRCLIENYRNILEVEELNKCLKNILDFIPCFDYEYLDKEFLSTFTYTNPGILISTSILINNRELSEYFFYYVIKNDKKYLKNDKIWIFLAVLVTGVNDDQIFKLVEITRDQIYELAKNDDKGFENTKYFLKSIGLKKEDIL